MTLGKLIYIFGIILFFYSIISGFSFHWTFNETGSSYEDSYTFKIGTLIIAVLMIYYGWKTKEREKED